MNDVGALVAVVASLAAIMGSIGGGIGVYVAIRIELASMRAEFGVRLDHVEKDLAALKGALIYDRRHHEPKA